MEFKVFSMAKTAQFGSAAKLSRKNKRFNIFLWYKKELEQKSEFSQKSMQQSTQDFGDSYRMRPMSKTLTSSEVWHITLNSMSNVLDYFFFEIYDILGIFVLDIFVFDL